MFDSKRLLLPIVIATGLIGCGSGGGGTDEFPTGSTGSDNEITDGDSGTPNTSPPVSYSTGVFRDSPVQGLYFETPSTSGLTNERGEFQYLPGETVRFKVGGIEIGESTGASEITPFSLFDVQPPNTEEQITSALEDSRAILTLDKALNIAMLLQNLDNDNDPSNGINLGNANEVFDQTIIDLTNIKSNEFIFRANINGLRSRLGITGSGRDLRQSIEHLYDSLNVQVASDSVESVVQAAGANGTNETFYSYDEEGRVVLEEIDADADGNIDHTISYRYNFIGQVVEVENSKQGIREELTYSVNNKVSSRTTYATNGDETRESYQYDGDDVTQFSFDEDNDGQPERVTTYDRSVPNQLTTRTYPNGDTGSSPGSVVVEVYENGLIKTYSEDSDNNGIADLLIAYSYDALGNRTSFNIAINGVSATGYSRFEYQGELVSSYAVYEVDINNNEILKYQERYTYDSKGQRKSYQKDLNGDGIYESTAQYKYDSNGNRISSVEDTNGDGIADKVWKQAYNTSELADPWNKIFSE